VHPFRAAIEARDIEAAIALLADDVEFHSPVTHSAYQGRDTTATILRAVFRVLEDFRYVCEIGDLNNHALVFQARVGDKQVEGCDFLKTEADGSISELMVMVRPLSGILALADAMKAELAR
jgi:limonene-1,2-epoxide hydrolase